MIVPVLCITCGSLIGDKAGLFKAMRIEKVKAALKEHNTAPDQAMIDTLKIDCSDIFDKLDIPYGCCRMHLTTAMEFTSYY